MMASCPARYTAACRSGAEGADRSGGGMRLLGFVGLRGPPYSATSVLVFRVSGVCYILGFVGLRGPPVAHLVYIVQKVYSYMSILD